ncbi:MAG: hypothetical protein QME46_08225 [Thermoanaerobacteraceae bacterium]|nr:hypothetical protein [Thermoanaerobacteraceae bacterium]
MKKFKFRLESLLKIKKQERDMKKEKLVAQMNKLKSIETMIVNLIKEIDYYSTFYDEDNGLELKLWNYNFYKDYIANLSIRLRRLEKRKAEQMDVVKKLQVEYLRLKKMVDALEKMKSTKLQQHVIEMQKEEYSLMDDLALTNHFRQVDNNGRKG